MSNTTLDHHHKDQSGRGGIQNGLEQKNSRGDEFESTYMPQSNMNQTYGMAPTSESYMPSYYGQMPFPYMGGSEWSTGGDSMPYLSGYGGEAQQHNFMPDAMFGHPPNQQLGNTQQAYFNQSYNFLPASNDFSAWGAPPSTGHGGGGMPDNSRNPSFGQQSVTAPSYTGDYYHSIMPATPHDYLGGGEGMPSMGSNMLGHIAAPANMPALGSSNVMPGGVEHMGKLPVGTSANGSKMMEQGLQNISLGVAAMTVDQMKQAPQQSLSMPLNVGPVASSGQNPNSNLSGQGGNGGNPPGSNAPKPVSWAAIASKPAKPQPKPKVKGNIGPGLPPPIKHNMDIGSWDSTQPPPPKGLVRGQMPGQQMAPQRWTAPRQGGPQNFNPNESASNGQYPAHLMPNESNIGNQNASPSPADDEAGKAILEKLKSENDYNPKRLTLDIRNARFFVIKSYSEDDIHRSIKYNIWCSTEHGNKRLDAAFRAQQGRGPVILLYSVNGSGHFCGVAEMLTPIDYSKRAGVWAQDKWKGKFQVRWIYAKDVPNSLLRHIRLENNENKPVTNSRDTQEVLAEKGRQVLKIISQYKHQTSIFDDFSHYERRQMEEDGLRAKRNEKSRARDNNRSGDSRGDNIKILPQQDQVEQISPRN